MEAKTRILLVAQFSIVQSAMQRHCEESRPVRLMVRVITIRVRNMVEVKIKVGSPARVTLDPITCGNA